MNVENNREDWLLWQISDSALPTGGFVASSGLESAIQTGYVHDIPSLSIFLSSSIDNYAFSSLPFVTGIPISPTPSIRTITSISSFSSIRTAEPVSADSFVMISKADTRSTFETYESLLSASKNYRNQMIALSQAAASFGQALERTARCKGADEAGPGLQAAAGLHYLMSNHQQLLSDTFYKQFEIPLLENFDEHKSVIIGNEETYEKLMSEMSKKIKETEARNLKNGRKRQRDLGQFRKALKDLTKQVEELEKLKNEHYKQTLENEQRNLNFILSKVSSVVKTEVNIFERICNKGKADPLLEQMITEGNDPFSSGQTKDQSSLSPSSIYNNNITNGHSRNNSNNNSNEIPCCSPTLTNFSSENLGIENRSSPLKINRPNFVSNISDLASLSPNSGNPSDNEDDGTTVNNHHFLNISGDSDLFVSKSFNFDSEENGSLANSFHDVVDGNMEDKDCDENDNTPNQAFLCVNNNKVVVDKEEKSSQQSFLSNTDTKPLFGSNSPFITRSHLDDKN
ncbi:12543_t:CDS:2 [Entrophospora sp. SA101]|nr:6445_t:CDS:2 [Entrophospora sp. SA101]CAJ0916455.1 12528_t:CDS:2 [Entrophospora sp. SA101]CAJ0916469.1 12543_t:CDS:2 [Entrophospora sp. SA101]